MSEPSVEFQEPDIKQAEWDKKRVEIDRVKDGLGRGIDEGIKDTVVAFNLLGINTIQSCEGHDDSLEEGLLTPWIEISAPNEPENMYNGQEEVFRRIAQKYGVSVKDITPPVKNLTVYNEAISEASGNGTTNEWEIWNQKTEELVHQVQGYLTEFYRNREADSEILLRLDNMSPGRWKVWSGSKEEHILKENFLPKASSQELLSERRAEMAAFTEFLREKYFR